MGWQATLSQPVRGSHRIPSPSNMAFVDYKKAIDFIEYWADLDNTCTDHHYKSILNIYEQSTIKLNKDSQQICIKRVKWEGETLSPSFRRKSQEIRLDQVG